MNALTLSHVRKVYPTGTVALHDVSLTIPAGGFYALLGPNGAGKTTLIGIVMGLVEKTGGSVEVFGIDATTHPQAAKAQLGIVPQEVNFNPFEKCLDIVVNQAGYYGIPRREALPRAEALLKSLGLGEKLQQPARTLSGGMKRRLMIARALVQKPKLLILDEPTAGVDVELRRSMWEFLQGLVREGVTILLTTHYLEEAEALCENIAIINHGHIIRQGPRADLLAVTKENPHDKTFKGGRLEEVYLQLTQTHGQPKLGATA
ncbi:MAG: ABC transporter ATP-binding protein [Alphaproteobacteria bacterium]|nr:ABC transporter ATP-binding protein [Alphaproteobacteria bacterium]